MKERKNYRVRTSAYLATSIVTLLGALSINVANAESDAIDIATCQALSDSQALDTESLQTRIACYSRDVEHLNQVVTKLTDERTQLIKQAREQAEANNIKDKNIEGYKEELANRQDSMQRLEERTVLLTQQINELTADRNQLREQLHSLLSQGQERAVDVEANDRIFKSFSDSYMALNVEILELKNKLEEYENKNNALSNQQAEQTELAEQLQNKIATLEQTVADAGTEKMQLEAEVASANEQLASMKNQLLDNAAIAQERITQIAQLKTALNDSEQRKLELEANIDSLNTEHLNAISALNDHTTALSDEILALEIHQQSLTSSAQNSADEMQATIAARDSELSARDAEIAKITKSRRELNAQRQALIAKITSLEESHLAQTQSLKAQGKVLETKVATLTDERTALGAEIDKQKSANDALKELASNSNGKNEELNLLANNLRNQLENEKSAATELQANIESLNMEANAQTAEHSKKLASLKSDAATLKTLLDLSRAHSENADSTLTELRSEIDASESRLLEKQKELQALLAEKESIENNFKAIANRSQAQAAAIKNALNNAGHENVAVTVSEDNNIELLLGSGQLFNTGSSRLSAEGKQVLRDLATAFDYTNDRRIMISGHSDNVPLGPVLSELHKDNWGLSMARALSTSNFLNEEANITAERMTVSGFGATRPIASNDTAEGRQQNRRVEIQLVPMDNQIASAK